MGDVALSTVMLIVLIGGWRAIADAMKKRDSAWCTRHLSGMLLASAASLGILFVGLALGVTASPSGSEEGRFASYVIGALLIAPIVFAHEKLNRSATTRLTEPWLAQTRLLERDQLTSAGQPSEANDQPASEQAVTPASRKFVPLTREQRKTLPKAKPISRKDSKRSPIFKTPSAEPTRAIREGWGLCSIAFEYEDAYGEWTERTVTVHSVTLDYLKGECRLRHAERTFRLDRIMSDITDIDTGEILDVDEWAQLYA